MKFSQTMRLFHGHHARTTSSIRRSVAVDSEIPTPLAITTQAARHAVHFGSSARATLGTSAILARLPAGDGPYDSKGLGPRRDRVGQWSVRQLMGQILLAGEEP